MRNIFKKCKEVKSSFYEFVLCQDWWYNRKKMFQIAYNPVLTMIVNLCIYFDWFNNHGKFKPGDKVKYNLFAHVSIPGIERIKGWEANSIYTFVAYEEGQLSKSHCIYRKDDDGETDGCDVFWLKKVSK